MKCEITASKKPIVINGVYVMIRKGKVMSSMKKNDGFIEITSPSHEQLRVINHMFKTNFSMKDFDGTKTFHKTLELI